MIKYLAILFLLIPSLSFADISGSVYFGKYFESKYYDLEDRPILYHAGVYLEIDLDDKLPVLFLDNKTFITNQNNTGFNPSQTNYKLGLRKTFDNIEVIYQHECLHPVDGTSDGAVAQGYNLIEIKYNF